MRKWFIVTGFISMVLGGWAQQRNPGSVIGPERIAAMEEKAHQQSLARQFDMNTVASDNFDVNFYRCEWEVDPAVQFINGKVTSYFTITQNTGSITFDLEKTLTVDSVRFRNSNVSFVQTVDNGLQISFGISLNNGQRDSVSIYYKGVPNPTGMGSFKNDTHSGVPILWTLSEPYGAKDWWPCKNANSDKADSIDIVITCPAAYSSSSNGTPVFETVIAGKRTTYWKHRYAIASYLVAMAVTNYAVEVDSVAVGSTMLPLKMYSYPEYGGYPYPNYFAKLSIPKFSSLFGDYPFLKESYSQTLFNVGGGMEHQTNSFIGNDWNQLVAHELGHQWFGDKVTCANWQEIWLNEGFAQYLQFIFVENFDPGLILAHLDYYRKIVVSQPGGSVKVDDTTNVSRIFSSRLTYAKGSGLVHMIRWRLGDSLFFKALRQYLNDPLLKYKTATTSDLKRNLEQASGQDFTEFFKDWYEGQGFPSYQVVWSRNKNNWIKVKIGQTTSHPSVPFYEMPVPLQFKSAGKDTTLVFNHTSSGQEFWVNIGFTPDTILVDPKLWLLSANNTVTKITGTGKDDDIKIYPNPAPTQFNILLTNPADKKLYIQLYNAVGQIVMSKQIETPGKDELIQIPIASLPRGVYWVRIRNEKGLNYVNKIVH